MSSWQSPVRYALVNRLRRSVFPEGNAQVGASLYLCLFEADSYTVEPIIGGDLSGAINATIKGGLAYPEILVNGTVDIPQIIIYGTTEDNSSFLIQEDGIGKLPHQNTRIVSDTWKWNEVDEH